MQIVIDIPKEMMSYINKNEFNAISEAAYGSMAMLAIKNGTPLPKGHGAIKDVSQIEIPMCEDRSYERWVQVAINAAPTIIEADRSEES